MTDVRERVAMFAANHPRASPTDVLARCPGVNPTDPDHRAVIDAVLGQDSACPTPTDRPNRTDRSTESDEHTESPDTSTNKPPNDRSRNTNPGCETSGSPSHAGGERGKHENPIDAADVTNGERARMLLEYLDAFRAEFGRAPKLMPLDSEEKGPIIQANEQTGREGVALDSPEADALLVGGYEAARQIHHDGARGFAIYAGRPDHGTEGVAFVDHDDTDAFPAPTGEPTLEALTGSGRGTHETYRNDPDEPVRNARVTGESGEAGEVRAANWYVVVPGSVHPSGGVYHVVEERPITTLSDSDLTDGMRSASKRQEGREARTARDVDGDGERPDDETVREQLEAAFERSPSGEKYRAIYDGRYASAGYSDRSAAEYALANWIDMWVGFGDRSIVASVLDAGNLQKWSERPDAAYRDSILANVGLQDWYAGGDSEGGSEDVEHVAVLPNSPRARAAANGWDWQSADRGGVDDALTIDDARERTSEAIADAYEAGDRALIEALPTMGKSHGAIAAAETGAPITVLTGRGNEEQYEQIEAWCAEYGLRAKVLPSVMRDCETFAGEHGEEIEATVKDWYRRGATGKDIHKDAEYELGEPLPCDGPAGRRCSYKIGWEFDPEEYDVLIGNYLHGHVGSATQGRTIVVDEFPGDAFETILGGSSLAGAVTHFLQQHNGLPFDDHADLLENRNDPRQRADALAWFQDHAPDRDGTLAFESSEGHAAAPLAAYVILAGAANDLGNGWERTSLPGFENGVGLYDRESGHVHLLTPPDLRYTRGVVGLDGTPTPALWELSMGTRLNHRPVLTGGERAEYVRDTLGLSIVRTTDAVKPYSGTGEHVATQQDRALIEAIGEEHDRRPSLLTTQTAEDVYREAGVLDDVRDVDHYGNLKGSNERESERLGAVIGSRHFGDGFVQKWGAFAGEAISDPDRSDAETRGRGLSYGGVGDNVLRHVREHETLQAVMRFGRDGRGGTVYVHTNALPAWIEDGDDPVLAGEGRVIGTWSDGMRQVLDVARDLGANGEGWTTGEVADHPAVEIGERQVRDHLHRLARRGYVDVETAGTGFVWHNDGLHRVGEHGEVELGAVDVGELDDEESAELSRSSSYTWEFRRSPGERGRSPTDSLETRCASRSAVVDDGEPPPDWGG